MFLDVDSTYKTTLNTVLYTGDKPIVECTADLYWASGLNEHLTKTTSPSKYKGKNMLGALLEEMRSRARIIKTDSD